MSDTIQEVSKAIKSGDQLKGLQSLSKQWNSIKNFTLLYSTLKNDINKTQVDYSVLIQKFQEELDIAHENEFKYDDTNNFRHDIERVYTKVEKQKRIKRYLEKKKRRKKKYFIRYEIRKTLANNRLRNKGKFIKNKKIDINKLIEMVKNGKHRCSFNFQIR